MRRACTVSAVLIALAAAGPAAAAEFVSPEGYTLRYPDGWVLMTSLNQQNLPPEVRHWLQEHPVDLSQIGCIVVDLQPGGFSPNVNVVAVAGVPPPTAASAEEAVRQVRRQMEARGLTLKNMSAQVRRVGPREAIVLDFDSQPPVPPVVIHQRQAYIGHGSRGFVLTCTAGATEFERYSPTFDQILADFVPQLPTEQSTAGRRWGWLRDGLASGVAGGIIGGVVGVLAGLVVLLLQPRRHCPECQTPLPKFRRPSNFRHWLWGGWICPGCRCEIDRKGCKIGA